jgi:hypothetical protein
VSTPAKTRENPKTNPARQKTTHPTEAGQVTQKSREVDQQSAAAPPSMGADIPAFSGFASAACRDATGCPQRLSGRSVAAGA